MRITSKQIAAAMGLAGLQNNELAKLVGMNHHALGRILNETVTARNSTLDEIKAALESKGIEFLDNQGVRFRPEGLETLNGTEGLETFFDQVYAYLNTHGGLVCVSGVDEAQFAKHHGEEHAAAHVERMKELVKRRNDIKYRVLLREGDTNFMANDYCQYLWQSSDHFVPTPFYVFGNYLALITFQAEPSPKIMVIQSEAFANAYRKQFDITWSAAKEPKKLKDKS